MIKKDPHNGLPPKNKIRNTLLYITMAAWVLAGSASQATIIIDPAAWELSVGDTFRLVMVTNGTTNAASTNITDYDTFINTQGLTGINYNGLSLQWQALGTTIDSVASSDPTRFSSQANATKVFNLGGEMVSNNNFWAINHDAPINMTIDGDGTLATLPSGRAYTGFGYDGLPRPQRNHTSEWDSTTVYSALGQVAPYTGITYDDDMNPVLVPGLIWGVAAGNITTSRASWPDGVYEEAPDTTYHHMYAISELITVVSDPVPEPTQLVLIGLGTILLAARRKKRTYSA